MNKKKNIVLILCAFLFAFEAPAVMSKSEDMISDNITYRQGIIMEPDFKIYVKSSADNYIYYGAKFEPRAGIYIGTPVDRKYPGIDNAINTEYDWFVPNDETDNAHVQRHTIPEKQSEHTTLTGYNWNFSLKNDKVIDIKDYSNYLYNKIDEIAARGEDVLLMFGKEMNIDDNFNDPELFKECFRFVADYARTKQNIAMVWSPNDTGGLDTTLEEFYPGDEYVDWIGCSMYTMPYFQGNPQNDDVSQMSFIMGPYANPSMRAKLMHDFLERNDIEKPVFITEGGVGYESPEGVDYTDWAKNQLRMYYADICRAYPEFKCIVSFNHYVYPGDLYRYDIVEKPELLNILRKMTDDKVYLKKYPSSAPYAYTELSDGTEFTKTIELSSYAYIPRNSNLIVRYLIDGELVTERNEAPYDVKLTGDDVSYGAHIMTCEIWDGEKVAASKQYNIVFSPTESRYLYRPVEYEVGCKFTDMADKPDEMRKAILQLTNMGVIHGVGDSQFAPDKPISRGELSVMLSKLLHLNGGTVIVRFTDVNKSSWYYNAVNASASAGLLSGYEDRTFRGNNAITRNEFITILAKILSLRNKEAVPDIALSYDDQVHEWVSNSVKLTKAKEIILERSDNQFCGTLTVKRGDAAVMLSRLYDALER